MKLKFKKKLKKRKFHPVTTLFIMLILLMFLSFILSIFKVGASYKIVNPYTYEVETTTIYVKNIGNFEGIKYLITNSFNNLQNFKPLATLLICLIGLGVAHASGLINAFIRRITTKIDNKFITFIILFLATTGTIINDAAYVILIPLAALIYLANKRSPLLGIVTAFCGTAFGYGTALFAGTIEVKLSGITHLATYIGDKTNSVHIGLLSNIYIMIPTTIIISFVGTYIIENIIVKRVGRYKLNEEILSLTKEVDLEAIKTASYDEKEQIKLDLYDRKGLRKAFITGIFVIIIFIYMIIPGLPLSGMLLDKSETSYIAKLFGNSSHFADGFTVMIMLYFMLTGIAYAIGSKTIKSDKELFEKTAYYLKDIGYIILTIFFYVLFIYSFNESNIGTVIACWGANLIGYLDFRGVPLVIISMIIIGIIGIFEPSVYTKWSIFSPVMVPLFSKSNLSAPFTQFVFRAADSLSKGITPFMAYFVIYLVYLNIYNTEEEPITIKKSLSYIWPYFLIISVVWILIILAVMLLNLPVGPGIKALV